MERPLPRKLWDVGDLLVCLLIMGPSVFPPDGCGHRWPQDRKQLMVPMKCLMIHPFPSVVFCQARRVKCSFTDRCNKNMKSSKRCQAEVSEIKTCIVFIHHKNDQCEDRVPDMEDKIVNYSKELKKEHKRRLSSTTLQQEDQSKINCS